MFTTYITILFADKVFVQWFLAYSGSFRAEDTYYWLAVPTAIY